MTYAAIRGNKMPVNKAELDLFEPNAIAASRIAKYAQCKVIIVNFRLVPEFPLSTCLNFLP